MTKTNLIAEPGKQEIVITRIFDAPRELVFKVFTDPNLMPEWWGPKSLTTTVDKMEVRPGGVWRFVHRDADGNEYAFHGYITRSRNPSGLSSPLNSKGYRAMCCLKR